MDKIPVEKSFLFFRSSLFHVYSKVSENALHENGLWFLSWSRRFVLKLRVSLYFLMLLIYLFSFFFMFIVSHTASAIMNNNGEMGGGLDRLWFSDRHLRTTISLSPESWATHRYVRNQLRKDIKFKYIDHVKSVKRCGRMILVCLIAF